jgi:cell shape-determining protein MreC
MLDESEKEHLRRQLEELRRALRWEKTQKERLLEDLGSARRENQRLRTSLAELEARQENTVM